MCSAGVIPLWFFFFFLNDPAPTEIYPLSLHDALPISIPDTPPVTLMSTASLRNCSRISRSVAPTARRTPISRMRDRKSTRLNSSHLVISYAVFCLKKNNTDAVIHDYGDSAHDLLDLDG